MNDVRPNAIKEYLELFLAREIPKDSDIAIFEQAFNQRWYAGGEKDYSAYATEEYLYIGYLCFKRYSRGFTKLSVPILKEKGCKSVLDYGAGIGANTLLASKMMPKTKVFYQNLVGMQHDFAGFLFNEERANNITMCQEELPFISVDAILCFELFEHVKAPLDLLEKLATLEPKMFIISNSFRPRAYGHYTEFEVDGKPVNFMKMSRVFNKKMRELGYEKNMKYAHPVFWNSRPAIWEKAHV